MNPQLEQELYDEIRSTFTAVEPTTAEEFMEVISSVFTSSGHWTDRSDCNYLEPMFGDKMKPLLRFVEQRPAFSTVTFTMKRSDKRDSIAEYAEQALTSSRRHLLVINTAMARFFLRFGLLPRCLYSNSREKALKRLVVEDRTSLWAHILCGDLLYAPVEHFNLSPIVLCGALRPSELLEQAQGHTSVVVFPY